MSAIYWGEAVMTAVQALNGKTPYEAWHGRKPVVSHLRVFGCLAFAKELDHVGKLNDRSTSGVFIGTRRASRPTASSTLRPVTPCSTKGEA